MYWQLDWIPQFQLILDYIELSCGAGMGVSVILPFPLNAFTFITSASVLSAALVLDVNAEYIKNQALAVTNESNLENKILILDDTILTYYDLLYTFQDQILGVTSSLTGVSSIGDFGDLFISTDSQLADGFSNIERYKKVFEYDNLDLSEGLNGLEDKRNFDITKKAVPTVAIVHNLETYDSGLHNQIISNIVLDIPSTIYIVEDITYDTIEITGLDLPSYYNNSNFSYIELSLENGVRGKTVSSIGASAFTNQAGITSIALPNSITNIGNSAFENCSNLTTISILGNVQSIGTNAFRGCSSLTSINIPSSTTSIGDGVFAGCDDLNIMVDSQNPNYSALDNILYNKTKTKLISAGNVETAVIVPNTVTNIAPYAFEGNNKLTTIHIFTDPTIGDFAFANCSNMWAVYMYSYDVPIMGTSAFANDDFYLYTPYISQPAYSIAFTDYTNRVESIQVEISFLSGGIILNTSNVYYGSVITSLTEPSKTGYDFSGWYDNPGFTGTAFQIGGIWNAAEDMSVYAKWTPKQYFISFAGYGSGNLDDKIVIYDEAIGALPVLSRDGYTFLGWKTSAGQYYTENTIFQEPNSIELASDWSANEYTITFDGNGGTPSIISQTVEYDSIVTTIASATRIGYTFNGWNTAEDGSGQTIAAPFTYTNSENITLFAQWQVTEYYITYNLHGGTQAGSNPIAYTILSDNITFNNPTKTGYTFVNWQNGSDVITGIPTGSYGDLVIDADWEPNQYIVILNANGGTCSVSSFVATYDNSFSIVTVPSRIGYTFEGWYDSNGVKYMTASGESVRTWDKSEDSTLIAQWAIKSYEIQINDNGSITWLGASGGLSYESCSIEYGTVLNTMNLIAIFKASSAGYKDGKIFDHFEYNDEQIHWTSIPDLGEHGRVITIVPVWIIEQHTIYFNTLSPIVLSDIIELYDTNILLPSVNSAGYVFNGWFTSASGGMQVNWTKMPDLTLGTQNNGSITLFAQYSLIPYSISYVLNGGTNDPSNPSSYNVESDITLYSATRTGYIFSGWFSEPNFVNQITKLKSDIGHKTLHAKWTPITYYVKYNANGGTGSIPNSDHKYDVVKQLRNNSLQEQDIVLLVGQQVKQAMLFIPICNK